MLYVSWYFYLFSKVDNVFNVFLFNTFIFLKKDVDLLPEDERNIYSCPETPRHMSSAVSSLKYK